MTLLTIRDAHADECTAVASLILNTFEQYRGKLDPPSGAHNETPETVREKMTQGGAIIALIGAEWAGVVLFYPHDGHLYLGRLGVLPAFRYRGLGQALVAAVEQKARESGFSRVELAVRVALSDNRAFFERQGYQVVSYGSHPEHSEPTFMTLEKQLG